jgi:hypothetical protein
MGFSGQGAEPGGESLKNPGSEEALMDLDASINSAQALFALLGQAKRAIEMNAKVP